MCVLNSTYTYLLVYIIKGWRGCGRSNNKEAQSVIVFNLKDHFIWGTKGKFKMSNTDNKKKKVKVIFYFFRWFGIIELSVVEC